MISRDSTVRDEAPLSALVSCFEERVAISPDVTRSLAYSLIRGEMPKAWDLGHKVPADPRSIPHKI
jgi:hypothetical protein